MLWRAWRIPFKTSVISNSSVSIKVVIRNFRTSYFDFILGLHLARHIVTGRNEVVAKVIFLHLFVILFTGEGVCLSACWDTPPRSRHPPGADTPEQTSPQADTPQELTPPEQTPPRADTPRADTPWSRHLLEADTPRSRYPPRSRHPPEQTPPGADPPEQTPPGSRHPREETPAYGQ